MKNFIKPLMFMLLITVMALAVTSCQASTTDNTITVEQTIDEPTMVVAETLSSNYGELATTDFDEIEFNPELISQEGVLKVEGRSSVDVLKFVEQWALDNFSSEPIENAILPSALDVVSINYKTHATNIYFKDTVIPIQILATVKGNRLIFNIKYLNNADYPATNIGNSLLFQFASDYNEWNNLE